MYLLVLFLLSLLFLNNSFAISDKSNTNNSFQIQEKIPFIVFVCEYCNTKQQKISNNYNKNFVQKLKKIELYHDRNWSKETQNVIKKQQDSEYQVLGTKSWPPQIPFAISPLSKENGLLVFVNYPKEQGSAQPIETKKYILFYKKQVIIGESEDVVLESLTNNLPKLSNKMGVKFFIAKDISGNEIPALENVIKNFTANKNSIMIPYEVTKGGVYYRSDINVSKIMHTIKQVNQNVPNLSAKIASGTIDVIEVTKSK